MKKYNLTFTEAFYPQSRSCTKIEINFNLNRTKPTMTYYGNNETKCEPKYPETEK